MPDKVTVIKSKLDALANAVAVKSGERIPLTLDEMTTAVNSITSGGEVRLQNKTVTPTESTQDIEADEGYDALGIVEVEAISSNYVGTSVPRRTSQSMSVSGGTVTAPSGYYETAQSKSVGTMTLPTETQDHLSGPEIATITQSVSGDQYLNIGAGYNSQNGHYTIPMINEQTLPQTLSGYSTGTQVAVLQSDLNNSVMYLNIPEGYNDSDKYYQISPIGSGVATAPSSITATGATTSFTRDYLSGTDFINLTKTVPVTPSVTTAGYVSSGTQGNCEVTLSSSIIMRDANSVQIADGVVTIPSGYYENSVTKSVPLEPSLQTKTKTYTPTESQQTETVSADTGYDGLQAVDVTVNAISSTYVGSGITRRSSSDLTASGNTVTVPSGYYAASATKGVGNGVAGTPTATKGTVSNHSVAVTPSVTNTTGYITGGTKTGTAVSVSASELVSGTYSVTSAGTKDVTNYASVSVPSGTATAPTSVSASSATVSMGTNTLTLTKSSVSITPRVTTAGYVSSGTAGNASVSLTASVTTKEATTYNTSASDQTIASGTYLAGTQTIRGVTVSGLNASDIASGVTVKVGDSADDDRIASVTGTLAFQTYYTGSSAPSSSLGVDGDIYLKTS